MNCDVLYEELAALVSGDLDAKREATLREHAAECERCRKRLDALTRADTALGRVTPHQPSAAAMLDARRAIADEVRGPQAGEIMTLDEVAAFLQLEEQQMDEVADELPAFELAGQIRVRRSKLMAWIEQRERDYARQTAASWVTQTTRGRFGKGVA